MTREQWLNKIQPPLLLFPSSSHISSALPRKLIEIIIEFLMNNLTSGVSYEVA